jgi:hypothetical protein
LGESFLRQLPYLVDYRHKKLWLGAEAVARAGALRRLAAARQTLSGMEVPVAFGAGARTWRLRLDSGVNQLLLSCGGSCPPPEDPDFVQAETNSSAGPLLSGFLRDVAAGGIPLSSQRALLGPAADSERDGLLPMARFSAVYVNGPDSVVMVGDARR